MVIITDYQEIESLLLRRHSSLDRSSQTTSLFKTILPRALLTLQTGDVWRKHRKGIGTAMTPRFLALTMSNITKSAQNLVELWNRKGELSGGRSWEAEVDLESAMMDAICGLAFGESWNVITSYTGQLESLNSDIGNDLSNIGSRGEIVFHLNAPDPARTTWYIFQAVPVESPFPALSHFFTRLTPSYRYHTKRMDDFLEQRLAEARHKASNLSCEMASEAADNTFDLLIAKQLGEGGLSDDEIKQELFQYLLAGTETSSTTLAWISRTSFHNKFLQLISQKWCKFMTNNPAIQRKLRQHLLNRLPQDIIHNMTFDDLIAVNLPYLEAVVHETLRMARTAGGFLRDTKEDMCIMGHHIPKGTTLAFPTSIGHQDLSSPDYLLSTSLSHAEERRVGYWKSGTGHVFDPERWLTEDGQFNAIAGPSLPFSLGQRRCFGKNLALLELRIFIAHLSLSFFFARIPADQNSFDRFDKVISHPKDCFVRPVQWTSEEASC
nr:hypothetical protein I302_03510 [Kwoniella bestiolae CBS 10118]OCF25836.1 hypothetical protein I302_03510 [Kwoniella bestiolae CBS 10118]